LPFRAKAPIPRKHEQTQLPKIGRGAYNRKHKKIRPHLRIYPSHVADKNLRNLLPPARGYFGIGAEGISKPVNLGNLLRSAHAFGASFVFTIGADARALELHTDTSKASAHLPLYHWRSLAAAEFPKGCSLVGVEILDEAEDLPSFPHPLRAAYVLGPERGRLSPELVSRCRHVVRIPAAFSLNLATAGAIVMYDRLRSLGRFGSRPVAEHAEAGPLRPHVQGPPRARRKRG
jgi:tRNA G18 (ribose-2'-O)-methylase SpoU